MFLNLFIQLLFNEYFCCFQYLGVMKKVALKIHLQDFFFVWMCASLSLDEVGVLGHMEKCMLNFKRNFQTLFESGSPVLHCYV